jgi:transposase
VKGPDVVEFLDALIRQGDVPPTVIVLDNAYIHQSIDQDTLDRWFLDHKARLFYLPPHSPELNLIEIVWKNISSTTGDFSSLGQGKPATLNSTSCLADTEPDST